MMIFAANRVECIVIAGADRFLPLGAQLAHPRARRDLDIAVRGVMLVRVDAERLAQRGQQMVLVHLRVALHGVVLDVLGQVPQLGERHLLQALVRMRHELHLR